MAPGLPNEEGMAENAIIPMSNEKSEHSHLLLVRTLLELVLYPIEFRTSKKGGFIATICHCSRPTDTYYSAWIPPPYTTSKRTFISFTIIDKSVTKPW